MSVQAAFDILLARRGTMYDPHIVDRFIVLQPTLPRVPETCRCRPPRRHSRHRRRFNLRASTRASHNVSWTCSRRRCQTISASRMKLTRKSASVVATATAGPGADRVLGHTMALGYGVSGWVAASRSIIQETDAGLDFQGPRRLPSARLTHEAPSRVWMMWLPPTVRADPAGTTRLQSRTWSHRATGLLPTPRSSGTLYRDHPALRVQSKGWDYYRLSGTSMASAVTTGIVAQLLQANRHTNGCRKWPDYLKDANRAGCSIGPNAVKAVLQYTALQMRE